MSPTTGNPIRGYSPSAGPTVAPTVFTFDPTKPNQWYFSYPAGTVTVQCIVTWYVSGVEHHQTLQNTVNVEGPTVNMVFRQCGTMQPLSGYNPIGGPDTLSTWNGTGNPTAFALWGVTYNNVEFGIYEVDTVLDPACVPRGKGSWSYAQTIGGFSQLNCNPTTYYSGLDNDYWPYVGCPWTDADGKTDTDVFTDGPGLYTATPYDLTYVSNPLSWDCARSFSLYIFYEPPPYSVGGLVIYIPIELIPRNALGMCFWDGTTWTPTPPASGDGGSGIGTVISYPTFPTWTN